jgi:hypothetical protein
MDDRDARPMVGRAPDSGDRLAAKLHNRRDQAQHAVYFGLAPRDNLGDLPALCVSRR